jgi:hypothetical protein
MPIIKVEHDNLKFEIVNTIDGVVESFTKGNF